MKTKVLILGAGFGGLSAALECAKLKKRYPKLGLDVTLVDKNDFQLFTPDLYEIASASKDIRDTEHLKRIVCLNVRMALEKQDVHFIQANIERIDAVKKQARVLHTRKGTEKKSATLEYDFLVIALGSEPFYFNIPGMKEHSIPFKWIDDAIRIRETIYTELADKEQLHVLICGAGPSGIELAAEFMRACKEEVKSRCFTVTVVEGRGAVLPAFGPHIQRATAKRLRALGVRMKTNFCIQKASRSAVVSTKGESLKADVIIWAGGIVANQLAKQAGFQTGKRGQVPVRPTLQSQQHDNVFVIGDSAEFSLGTKFCPQTAHEAVVQGPLSARNIVRLIQKKSLAPHRMSLPGTVIALGGKNGIVAFTPRLFFTGFLGWLVRKYVDFRHFHSVLPFMHACSVWYEGVKLMGKND